MAMATMKSPRRTGLDVDAVIFAHFAEDRLAIGVNDRGTAWRFDGGEGEIPGIRTRKRRAAGFSAKRLERQEIQCGGAGGDRKRVFAAHEGWRIRVPEARPARSWQARYSGTDRPRLQQAQAISARAASGIGSASWTLGAWGMFRDFLKYDADHFSEKLKQVTYKEHLVECFQVVPEDRPERSHFRNRGARAVFRSQAQL